MKHNTKGFTLVEMIVVIAIIAILAAVIIPTTAGFIDRARLSNDRQNATRMTQALEVFRIETGDTGPLQPHDVREILDAFSDTPFNLEPEARHTGYFYIPPSPGVKERIMVLKFDEAEGLDLTLHTSGTALMHALSLQSVSAQVVPADITMPEALFGNDRLLLSTSGSIVADIVYGIRHGFNSSLLADYNESRAVFGLIGNRYEARLESLLEAFDPDTTLFISNGTAVGPQDGTHTRVVFAPGTAHLPNLHNDVLTEAFISLLPRTLKTHELSGDALNTLVTAGLTLQSSSATTIDLSSVTATRTGNTITYDLSNIPNRHLVTGYTVGIFGDTVTIRVFTKDGLSGTTKITVTE